MLCVQGRGSFVKKTDSVTVGMDTAVVRQSGKQSHQETGNILSCRAQRNRSASVSFVGIPDSEIILRERESGFFLAALRETGLQLSALWESLTVRSY